MSLILYTTSLEVAVTIVMTGPVIDATIGPVLMIGIVGGQMVEAVRSLGDLGLVKSPPLRGLAMRSSLSMTLDVILWALGATGVLVGVEALLSKDPLPVVAQQPRGILRRQGILAKAAPPLNGEVSTLCARDP